MAALNKAMFIGNLGRDPEVRTTPSGSKVATFSIAVTEKIKDKDGNPKEITEWVNIVLWRRQAEIAEQYLRKGSQIYIEGKLQTTSWDDQNGQKRYKTEVLGSNFQMLGSKGGNSNDNGVIKPQNSSNNQPSIPDYDDKLPF